MHLVKSLVIFQKSRKAYPRLVPVLINVTCLHSGTSIYVVTCCSVQIVLCEAESKNRGQGKGNVSYWQCVLSNNSLNPLLNQTLILWKLSRPNSCRFLLESDLKKESRLVLLRDLKSLGKATLTVCRFVRRATPWEDCTQ